MSKPKKSARMRAAEAGRVKYRAKDPCNHSGNHERYTSSAQCVTCTKDRGRESTRKLREALRG